MNAPSGYVVRIGKDAYHMFYTGEEHFGLAAWGYDSPKAKVFPTVDEASAEAHRLARWLNSETRAIVAASEVAA